MMILRGDQNKIARRDLAWRTVGFMVDHGAVQNTVQFKKRMGMKLGIGRVLLLCAIMDITAPKNVKMKILLQGGLIKDAERGRLLLRVFIIY